MPVNKNFLKASRYLIYILPIIVFIIYNTVKEYSERALGGKNNPVKIFVTPSVDAQTISTESVDLLNYLHNETGYYFSSSVPSSFVAVVEAFGSKRADIAVINAFSFLMAREKYGVHARLRLMRDNGMTTYCGQIVARADGPIHTLEDLNGKKVAFVDPSSASGYILPMDLLNKKGIKPAETVFAMKHDNVITMVYQGQVDAGASFHSPKDPNDGRILDARMRVLEQFPDVEEKVKIIALTESIPNDPVVFRDGIPAEMEQKIIAALLKYLKTPKGAEVLYQISDIKGLIPAKDSDYDAMKEMLRKLNIKAEKLVKK
ncbi:MAG: phosphate/phosphite/phosphonate ABC transporter substrate-binding protein [Ignavibacteriales bacterium]|nr:phosphate/phosphite/phosphonate ABC transporter substrate-binding protein [Ignavibacteriales bacterium]